MKELNNTYIVMILRILAAARHCTKLQRKASFCVKTNNQIRQIASAHSLLRFCVCQYHRRFLFTFVNNWSCFTYSIAPCHLHCTICWITDSIQIQFSYYKNTESIITYIFFLLSVNHNLIAGIMLEKHKKLLSLTVI